MAVVEGERVDGDGGPLCGPRPRVGLDRRAFLALLGAGGAAALRPTWFALPQAGAVPAVDPAFPHGIAAGDPRVDGSVIWTRVDPAADPGAGIEVTWEVSDTEGFGSILATGTATAAADADHTVHALVTGLDPDGWFSYRFRYGAHTSRTGRLRTAPAPGTSPASLRFTFSSCQQRNSSYYVAHTAMANEDLDFVVHYGDYIYVSDGGTQTLDDYRGVYRDFKANPLLQDLHARYPMVVMWDDGEFVNGVDSTMPEPRFTNAKRAWFEYQPVIGPAEEPHRAYRSFAWGDLADLWMLDVRTYRSKLVDANDTGGLLPTTDTNLPSGFAIFDPDRTCLGAAQKAWFTDELVASTATWRHVGVGYPFVALRLEDYDTPAVRADPPPGWHPNGGKYFSTEQWDGYWAERRELMDLIADRCIENVIVTSGHTHIYFESGLRPDYDDLPDADGHGGSPVVAREFVCGSLTADPDVRDEFFPGKPRDEQEAGVHALEQAFLGANPHVDYIDLLNQGYGLVHVTPAETRVDFRVIDTFDAQAVATTKASWTIPVGSLPAGICGPEAPPTTTTTEPPAGPVPGATPVEGTATYTG
jgi:alkaline phosphatase D